MATQQERFSIVQRTLSDLQEFRDQVRVRLHPPSTVKQQWERLETQLLRLQSDLEKGEAVVERTHVAISAALVFFRELLTHTVPNRIEGKKAFELMQVNVLTCSRDDTLARAAELMWNGDCGCIPVVDARRTIVGIITDRDISMAAHIQDARLTDSHVFTAMTHQVWTCSSEDTVSEALELMSKHRVRRLPVVDAEQRLLGIISFGDISRYVQARASLSGMSPEQAQVAETAAAISEPRRSASS